MKIEIVVIIFIYLIYRLVISKCKIQPHIIFILADDLGWNDVSFHGSPQIPTPNIDALAASGIVLQNYYSSPMCTPSRGSLMTGKYAMHIGLQHLLILAGSPFGLPLSEKILPEYLRNLNYKTHGIGKWHLGSHKKEYLPINRGFDSFFGYWSGVIDYYDHTTYYKLRNNSLLSEFWGHDLHDGEVTAEGYQGRYATDLFTEKAINTIRSHDSRKPLFLYLSHLAPHTGNAYQPLQAPLDYVGKFNYIKDIKRRIHAGMVSKLDESVGKVFKTLHEADMLENTILIISSDNGGAIGNFDNGEASNWPLRGAKYQLFEGGVRIPGLIWSPLFKLTEPRIYNKNMHISDWLPTLYTAAGGELKDLGTIDGINLRESLIHRDTSSRSEILLNIDPIFGESGLIQENFKILLGTPSDGQNSWYGPSGHEDLKVPSMDDWIWKNNSSIIKQILEKDKKWLIKIPNVWRSNLSISCDSPPKQVSKTITEPQLFDIVRDPCEYNNLAEVQPKVLARLLDRLKMFNSTALKPLFKPSDPHSDPRCHNFRYVPWLDEGYKSNCPNF